jgi:hypothetical protein
MRASKIVTLSVFALLIANIRIGGVLAATELSKEKIVETAKSKESTVHDAYKDDLFNAKSDPQSSFQSAMEKNDMRFAAVLVGGYASYQEVPGLDEKAKNDRLQEKFGTKIIADVSGDVAGADWYERNALKEAAQKFAEKYNQLLLAKIRTKV